MSDNISRSSIFRSMMKKKAEENRKSKTTKYIFDSVFPSKKSSR